MKDVETAAGIIKATVLAGPVFLLSLAILPAVTGHTAVVLRPEMVLAPLLLVVAVIPGALLAVGPVVLGTRGLAALGRGNPGMRHPAVWALAGAGAVAGVMRWLDPSGSEAAATLTATGAICAVLARSGVRWSD